MRYFQLVLSPESGGFHSLDDLVAEHHDLERVAILHIKLLNDDTGVALYLLDGDPADFEELLTGEQELLSYDVFESETEGFYAHVHFRPDDPATELLRVADRYRLVSDPPLEFTATGASA